MPIYEYECNKCHKLHEDLRSLNESNQSFKCVYCDGQMERMISAHFGIVRNGTPRFHRSLNKLTNK